MTRLPRALFFTAATLLVLLLVQGALAQDAGDSRLQKLPFAWPEHTSFKVAVDFRTIRSTDNATIVHSHVEHWVDAKRQRSLTIDTSDGGRGHPPSQQYIIQSLPMGCTWLYRPNLPCLKVAQQESQLRHVHLPLPVDVPAWVDTGAVPYYQQGELIEARRFILNDNSGKLFDAVIEPRHGLLLSATVKNTLHLPSPSVTLIDFNWKLEPMLEDVHQAFQLPSGASCPDYFAEPDSQFL